MTGQGVQAVVKARKPAPRLDPTDDVGLKIVGSQGLDPQQADCDPIGLTTVLDRQDDTPINRQSGPPRS